MRTLVGRTIWRREAASRCGRSHQRRGQVSNNRSQYGKNARFSTRRCSSAVRLQSGNPALEASARARTEDCSPPRKGRPENDRVMVGVTDCIATGVEHGTAFFTNVGANAAALLSAIALGADAKGGGHPAQALVPTMTEHQIARARKCDPWRCKGLPWYAPCDGTPHDPRSGRNHRTFDAQNSPVHQVDRGRCEPSRSVAR